MDWPIEKKVQWGLGIAVAVLCGMGMIAYALIVSLINTNNWVIHTHRVIESIQGARTGLDDAETSVRGYLLTQNQSFLSPYNLVKGRIPGVIDRIRLLTADNPAQQKTIAQLKLQVDRELELLQQAVDAAGNRSASPAAGRRLLDDEQQVMSNIRNTLRSIRLQEDQLLSIRDAAWRQDLTEAITAVALLALFNFVLLGYIYYAFTRDLAERRRAESALQTSEERLRLMIASVKDYAFFMLDPQGDVTTWNDGAAIIKGYAAGEIMGRPFSTFFTEEDRKAGKPAWVLENAAKRGRMETDGWRVRKDGSRFWTDAITSAIRDEGGRLLGFSEVARDLTERQAAEEKIRQSESSLAAILDGSPSVIFVKDPDGRYTLVNRRFEDALRMGRREVLGKTDLDLFPLATAQRLGEHDAKVLGEGRAIEFEEVIPQRDGLHTYLSARVPLPGEDNKPYAICGVSTDITQRKESDHEIQRLNRALQDRLIDHSVELMQTAESLNMERAQRQGAEEREREVRDRLREVMHRSPFPMWTYDLETLVLLEVNNAAGALHGSRPEELLPLRMTELYSPEEVSKLGKEVEIVRVPEETPRVWRHRAKDGRLIPVGILARRIEWQGRDAALVVVVTESEGHHIHDIASALEAASS
jgi:PAS domain S-box-containing protein